MPGVARGWHTVYTSDGYLFVAQLFRKCTLIPPKPLSAQGLSIS